MNQLAAPFRQLVERRLWPLALLLLLALAAVPFLLSKSEEVPPAAPVAAVPGATTEAGNALATQPIVSVGAPETREQRRKVLGSAKDPFKPAKAGKKAKAATEPKVAEQKNSALPKTDEALANAITNLVTVQENVKKTYELYSLTVRFGDSTATTLKARNLKRLKAMPSVAEPAFIYLGLLDDHKTAVFLVDANAKVQGDGKCMPNPENCQTLHMKVGDIAFFDVTDPASGQVTKQYQLDLVRIRKKTTTDRKEAAAANSTEASGGREALRARSSRINGYRYSRSSGTLRKGE